MHARAHKHRQERYHIAAFCIAWREFPLPLSLSYQTDEACLLYMVELSPSVTFDSYQCVAVFNCHIYMCVNEMQLVVHMFSYSWWNGEIASTPHPLVHSEIWVLFILLLY